MKKLFFVLIFSLLLTGCSPRIMHLGTNNSFVSEEKYAGIDRYGELLYVEDEFKEIILKINNLKEKYKNIELETGDNPLYIDVNNDYNLIVDFDSNMFSKEYYNDLIKILDGSIAKGLKDYIKDMETQKIEGGKVILKRIGRVAIYAEDREGFKDNFISIKVDFSSLKDENYKDIFSEVFEDKYFLNNIETADKLNMMNLVNLNSLFDLYYDEHLAIRYNVFLNNKDIKKVNILMQGQDNTELAQDDINVFINLLNTLDLNDNEKGLLLNKYNGVFQTKSSNQKISLDNYNLLINDSKGNSYSRKDRKLAYFSIERK